MQFWIIHRTKLFKNLGFSHIKSSNITLPSKTRPDRGLQQMVGPAANKTKTAFEP